MFNLKFIFVIIFFLFIILRNFEAKNFVDEKLTNKQSRYILVIYLLMFVIVIVLISIK